MQTVHIAARVVAAMAACALVLSASAATPAPAIAPSPWLVIDQNRDGIVADILARWSGVLQSPPAGALSEAQLRDALWKLRADQLFSASLAGSYAALVASLGDDVPGSSSKPNHKLGTSRPDLAYTPIVPCRIVDTRFGAGGTLTAGATRNWLATNPSGSFAAQGGSGTNCGIPVKAAAVAVNITVFNTSAGPAFVTAWPFQQAQPGTSTLNWTAAGSQVGIGALLSLCTGACAADFSMVATATTDMVVDVLGYFSAPSGGYVFSVAPAGAQFSSIQAAVDAAAALATANQPYLVRVAPGIYNEQVTLKDFVDVEGSGMATTAIVYAAGRPTVTTGAQAEMRHLTILNTAGGTLASGNGGIAVRQTAQTVNGFSRLIDVQAQAQGPGENAGIVVTGGPLHFTASDAGGGIGDPLSSGLQIGIMTDGDAFVTVRDSRVFGFSSDNARVARRLNASTLKISNTRLSGGPTEGAPNCFSVYNTNLQPAPCN